MAGSIRDNAKERMKTERIGAEGKTFHLTQAIDARMGEEENRRKNKRKKELEKVWKFC